MSECSIFIRKSRYRQYALLLAGCYLGVLFVLLPLAGLSYLFAGCLLIAWFYLLLRAWPQPVTQIILYLDDEGLMHWQPSLLADGKLSEGSFITALCLRIEWLDWQGKRHRFWLFKDQVSEQDYRAVARQLQLQRWR
ncbi:protein YgfX [Alishewanella sp. d11]|uniref:protein YgfX n=1 Tax=Alishewanella sp. d11 TaxID=3414030 RepID=UPI003BF7BD17